MKKLLEDAYKDAKKVPAIKKITGDLVEIGGALVSVVGLFAVPAGRAAEIGKKNLLKYVERMANEKPEDIQPVRPDVAIPILEKLCYTEHEELANRYVEMLAKESVKSTQGTVLPSYVQILSELSPDEVRIIDGLVKEAAMEIVTGKNITEEYINKYRKNISSPPPVGPITYQIRWISCLEIRGMINNEEYQVYSQYFNRIDDYYELDSPSNKDIYLVNLMRLGLLQHQKKMVSNDFFHQHLKECDEFKAIEKEIIAKGETIDVQKHAIEITSLSTSFVNICSRPEREH